jgi:hypothetical protein
MQILLCCEEQLTHFFAKLRVKPQPCVGYNSSSVTLCVPLQYTKDNAESSPFTFSYFSGGTLQSKSVPFNDGSPDDNNIFDLHCPFLKCPGGGYDLFFGSSDADELLWSSLFSPNSTYIDPHTRAVYIVGTFYEPSVQVRIARTSFNPSRMYVNYPLFQLCAAEICRRPTWSPFYTIISDFEFNSL